MHADPAGSRLLVIGGEDLVFGLGLLGLDGRVVRDAAAVARALSEPGLAIAFVEEGWARSAALEIEAASATGLVVVEVPGRGSRDGVTGWRDRVQRSLGITAEG